MTGCYAQREPQHLAENGMADLVVGNSRNQNLVEILERLPDKESGRAEGRAVREEIEPGHLGDRHCI